MVLQGVLDGKPQLRADRQENAEVISGERISLPPVKPQHADGPVNSFERHGQRGKQERRSIRIFQEAWLHQGVSVHNGFAVFRHPTTQALAHRNSQGCELAEVLPKHVFGDQVAIFASVDRNGIVGDEPLETDS